LILRSRAGLNSVNIVQLSLQQTHPAGKTRFSMRSQLPCMIGSAGKPGISLIPNGT
jgi:hypothetical protein